MKLGFMLFELLISIALFLLILGIGSTYFKLADSFLVRAEVSVFYTTSVYLCYRAQLERTDQILFLDLAQQRYSYNSADMHTLTKDVCFSTCFDAKGPPAYPEKIITKATSFVKNQIRFFADGSMQSGSLYFSHKNKDCLYAFTIPVSLKPCIRTYAYDVLRKKWEQKEL